MKEAYLWDLGTDSSRLTALLAYTISPGGTDSLAVRLPEGLEALSVEARRPRDGTLVRLSDWTVAGSGAGRTLSLDFPAPVSGEIDVTLDLAPRAPWAASFVLPLPSPVLPAGPAGLPVVGAGAAGLLGAPLGQGPLLAASALMLEKTGPEGGRFGRPKASFLAYRTRGLTVERVNPVGVTGIPYPFEDFAPFWPAATRPDPHSLAYASTLSREDGGRPPVLGLTVRPAAPADAARVDVELRVGPTQADLRATAVLTAREGGLSLVEWQERSAQPFTVTGVAGPNVKRWSQEGNRVLAWLEPPAKGEVKLGLTGWLPLSPGGRLELPNLRVLSAASQETTIRLIPGGGVALSEAGRSNLAPLPPSEKGKEPVGALAYTAGGREDYGAAWQVHAGPPRVRVYTVAGLSNHRLSFTSVVEVDPSFGGVEALEVRVRNWNGNVEIKEPKGIRQRPLPRGPDEWAWALELDPARAGRLRLVLSGEQPGALPAFAGRRGRAGRGSGDAGGECAGRGRSGPAVGGGRRDRLDGGGGAGPDAGGGSVGGSGRRAGGEDGPADPGLEGDHSAMETEPGAARRIVVRGPDRGLPGGVPGRAGRRRPLDARDRLLAAARRQHRPEPDAAGRRRGAVGGHRRRRDGAAAVVAAPAVAAADQPPGRLPGARPLALHDGRLARPNLDRPILEGAPDGPGLWTLLAPSGWRAESPERPGIEDKGDLRSGLTAAASLSWQRAEALLRISAALAQQAAEGGGAAALDDAQRRFYAECRRAREELEASSDRTAPGWPDGRKPIDVLQDLLERNRKLANTRHFEAVRAGAEAAVDADGAGRTDGSPAGTAEGRPLYAWTTAGAPAPKVDSGAGSRARAASVGGVSGMDEPAAADRLSVAVVVGRGLVARLVAGTDRPDRIGRLVGGGGADADRGVPAAAGDRRARGDDLTGRRPALPPHAVPVEIDRSQAGAAAGIVRIVEVRTDRFAKSRCVTAVSSADLTTQAGDGL